MITIAVAFVAVECTNVWLTGEHVLKTFENVVSIQKKGTERDTEEEERKLLFC